ncbi:MAG: hypothetical protein RLZZ244_2819 [Verrucomicrobiota bacterium]|jgi:polar amino acid transport system ATP-binding protein
MKIELKNLSKSFGSRVVLDSLSLTLESSRCLVLLGSSGSGKSTLLRILAGLDSPDSGTILLNGTPLPESEETLRRYRQSIGVVFQSFNLFPHLTALDNLLLPLLVVHRVPQAEARARAFALLHRFQLESHAHQKPAALSGGQRQRIAIARALVTKPSLLLLDEPTSSLDPEMTAEVLDTLLALREEGCPLILVTHELGFARRAADHLALLSEGRLAEVGPPEQLLDAPRHESTRRFLQRALRY